MTTRDRERERKKQQRRREAARRELARMPHVTCGVCWLWLPEAAPSKAKPDAICSCKEPYRD